MADRIRVSFVVGDTREWDPVVSELDRRPGFEASLATTVDDVVADGSTCVVVDHDPPAVDGLECVRQFADGSPSLPVLMHPTTGSEALASAAIAVGVDDYLPQVDGPMADALANRLRLLAARIPDEGSFDASADDLDVEGMMSSLLDTIPRWVSIFFKDRTGRHLAVNEHRSATLTETPRIETPDGAVLHTREDILGKTDFDLYPTENAIQTRRDERRIMRTEEPVINTVEYVADPVGRDSYFSVTKAPWYDECGTVRGIVGVAVDVSDRIHRERALERQNERLERFAAVLSHDLRNPLNVASGTVTLVRDRFADGDAGEPAGTGTAATGRRSNAELLDDALDAIGRMDQLIEEVLTLAREGEIVNDPEPCDLLSVANAAWRNAANGAATFEPVEPSTKLVADPERLQTALENLFRNAIEHGGEDVTVRVGARPGGFYVEDDGPGIALDEHESIFEYGYTTAADGTGFGLATVEEIVLAHSWSIEVCTARNGGARFDVRGVGVLAE